MSDMDRLSGVLLGTALGDALGLPAERLSARAVERRFGRVDRFRLLGDTGFVSDDTEQAALVAQSLARYPADIDSCVRDFRRALLGWGARVPWGAGRATLQACARLALGMRRSGVPSAGNGAAMRAAVIGAFFRDRPEERIRFGRALAEVTHLDPRAVEGALYVAELAATCARSPSGTARGALCAEAMLVVTEPSLRDALRQAEEVAARGVPTTEAAGLLGTTGYILHTAAFATFCFLRHGHDPLCALTEAISAGGDTDSIAAILGGWLGALHGEAGLPGPLLRRIHDGPFGPTHLRSLAQCLAQLREGCPAEVPSYSAAAALARNLALLPMILAHGFRRMLPF